MSSTTTPGLLLSRPQQETLLRGLRFFRNSLSFDMHEPTAASEEELRKQYAELAELETLVRETTHRPVSL